VKPEETSIARQRLGKQVSTARDMRATIHELLGTMFSIRSVQNCYKEFSSESAVSGVSGVDEKGCLESETVKYGHESNGTRTRKELRWRGLAEFVNDRPFPLVRESVPHQQTRNCL
jgi:hypothetical protein